MMASEYVDVARFPLTTWPGVDYQTQVLSDACDLEELHSELKRWNRLTRLQRDHLAELQAKASG
jgi:hypothetical protein